MKVLIIVGDASETLDTLYLLLQEAGIDFVAGTRKRPTKWSCMRSGLDHPKEWEGYTIEAKIAFKDPWNPNTPVSFSPKYIREDPDSSHHPNRQQPAEQGGWPPLQVRPGIYVTSTNPAWSATCQWTHLPRQSISESFSMLEGRG